MDFPIKTVCVRCDPKRTLLQVLQPIIDKLKLSIGQFVFYAVLKIFFIGKILFIFFLFLQNDSLIPLNLNDVVGNYDNQRIFTLTKTASGVGE
jgi:hypothetical protein